MENVGARDAVAVIAALVLLSGCGTPPPATGADPTRRPVVLDRVDHDTGAFTQGLQVVDDVVVKTTGLRGRSRLRVLSPDGTVLRTVALPRQGFGEGVAVADGTVWVLTLASGRVLRYSWPALEPLEELRIKGQGWGACHDGTWLWTSNGSAELVARDPGTAEPIRTVQVRDDSGPVSRLNELDCAPRRPPLGERLDDPPDRTDRPRDRLGRRQPRPVGPRA